ncbi:cilia- and flagella-associated protein 161 [Astyanax mexicanus]|uniref:Cilia- and flagella-associated protein 161 n=1 Tax=Astyanax mexicanus TaxID=7994 RepID=A0A8T2LI68_ASTMX|nr:cilia- and flagella-associated protein 161 [Astyanax mexicanus]
MSSARTYRASVRVGNWMEDVTLEKDSLKDFLYRRDRGELTVQKTDLLKQTLLKPVSLSVSRDGFLRFGDTVMLVNSGGTDHDPCDPCSLSIVADLSNMKSHPQTSSNTGLYGPFQVGGASGLTPCVRNALIITSVDGTAEGEVLRYEQSFALRTTAAFSGELYLASDHRTFQKCAKSSRLQEVSLVEQADFLCWWRVVYFDPQERLEHEGYPVQGNTKVLITHCKTNQCLAALANHEVWTPFGKEYELVAHTFLDSHKAEQNSNHWLFVTADPGQEEQSLVQRHQVSNENGSDIEAITDTPQEEQS